MSCLAYILNAVGSLGTNRSTQYGTDSAGDASAPDRYAQRVTL